MQMWDIFDELGIFLGKIEASTEDDARLLARKKWDSMDFPKLFVRRSGE